jgi:hypothetical protein
MFFMTRDYADHKISEALRLSGGNAAKARRLVQAWFFEDPKLLLELTRPHWNGIVAYAVDRGARMALDDAPENAVSKKAKKAAAASAKPSSKEGPIGKEMLRSFVSEKAPKFGHEGGAAPARRTASQNHVDAIHMLAAKGRQKTKKDR